MIRKDTWISKDLIVSDTQHPVQNIKYLEGTNNLIVALGDNNVNHDGA